MARNAIKALSTAALLSLTAAAASAGTSNFLIVNGVDVPGIDVSLTIQNSSKPGYAYDMVLTNHSGTGIVTGVYFENLWNTMLATAGAPTGTAKLNAGSLSPNIDDWASSKSSHTVGQTRVRKWAGSRVGYVDTYYDTLGDGIIPGTTHTFSFIADTNLVDLGDLEDAAGHPGFGVGIRVQNVTNDPYAAAWGLIEPMPRTEEIRDEPGQPPITGVPSPTAAFTGLALLGLAAARRRRS